MGLSAKGFCHGDRELWSLGDRFDVRPEPGAHRPLFTLSEQCIQPVFDRTNSSGTKMENCFQNLSTVIFVEGSIHGQDNVVSGPHGLSPTHLEAGHHGNTLDWPNKRFKIFTTVLGWPVALLTSQIFASPTQ